MYTLLDFLARERSVHESTSGFKVKLERKQNKEVNIKQSLLPSPTVHNLYMWHTVRVFFLNINNIWNVVN